MVRYSLSSAEHEIKRGIRRIQREIKQGIFVDIPLEYENAFDEEFYVKLANVKQLEDGWMEINGTKVELKNAEVKKHEYDDGNVIFYLSNEELKEYIEKFSYTLAQDLRLIILAVIPSSIRQLSAEKYVDDQYKFID